LYDDDDDNDDNDDNGDDDDDDNDDNDDDDDDCNSDGNTYRQGWGRHCRSLLVYNDPF